MSYTITSKTFTRLVNAQDSNFLTLSEQTLLMPQINKSRVEFEIDTFGNFAGLIDKLPVNDVYPPNVIGRTARPKHLKVVKKEFSPAGITYYNAKDEVIQASFFSQYLADYYVNLGKKLTERVLLAHEEFDLVMEAWEDAGFKVIDHEEGYSSIKVELFGGDYSYILIDRNLQSIIGTAHYRSDGSLISKSVSYIQEGSGTAQSPQQINSQFITPFTTPFSEVEMEIVIQSKITDINYRKSLK